VKRSIEEINKKIKNQTASVIRADEMTKLVKENGYKDAFKKVDIVTTGTFGAMCSSGVFFNFNHFDPPAKLQNPYLNGVKAYGGIASADIYLGATQYSKNRNKYGGAHVIEELIKGFKINLVSSSNPTDCYPGNDVNYSFKLQDLNQAIMLNPRNSYQKYNGAVNTGNDTLHTYMGKLLPSMGNINYSGSGELNPIMNDPDFQTIGAGSKLFIGGDLGMIVGTGTQHNQKDGFSNLMVKGDLKQMSGEYLRAGFINGYGPTLFLGIGFPIPILNYEMAKRTGIANEDIDINIIDFSIKSNKRPIVIKTNYKELKSGLLTFKNKKIQTRSLSSHRLSVKVADHLKEIIRNGNYKIILPSESL